MPTPKLQPSLALEVIESSDFNIPFPSGVEEGFPSSIVVGKLVDSTVNFETLNFNVGDVVYNTSTETATFVTGVSGSQLTLDTDIFTSTAEAYKVFPANRNQGCVVHLSTTTASDVITCDMVTASGNLISGITVSQGFFPAQVLNVYNATAPSGDPVKIVAFW
jgi:hypothetical protein